MVDLLKFFGVAVSQVEEKKRRRRPGHTVSQVSERPAGLGSPRKEPELEVNAGCSKSHQKSSNQLSSSLVGDGPSAVEAA